MLSIIALFIFSSLGFDVDIIDFFDIMIVELMKGKDRNEFTYSLLAHPQSGDRPHQGRYKKSLQRYICLESGNLCECVR